MAIKRRNKSTEFKGIDLNPHNVYGIFKMCSVPEDVSLEDTNEELIHAILYPKDLGYEKDSGGLSFYKEKIDQQSQKIDYLIGQLDAIHKKETFHFEDAAKKYTGEVWNDNRGILMALLSLGIANGSITPFVAETQTAIYSDKIVPTLSPSDPNFTEWFQEYTLKMKKAKNLDGQEPGDD